MLDFLVGLSIYSLFIAIYGTLVCLPIFRLIIVIIKKTSLKESLYIVLIPLSIGYYLNHDDTHITHKIYIVLQILLFVFALLGSFFLFYTRFA